MGVPQIEVTFELERNGNLNVLAKDKGTGKENRITIDNDIGRLSKYGIEQMVTEAEECSESDKVVKAKVDALLTGKRKANFLN